MPANSTTASRSLSASASATVGITVATLHAKAGNVADTDLGITITLTP